MIETFCDIQKNAKSLSERVNSSPRSTPGCFTFFSHDNNDDIFLMSRDARTISTVAYSLDACYDVPLIRYLHNRKNNQFLTWREFKEFKKQTLVGCYLLQWKKYLSSTYGNAIQLLIDFFQQDLGIQSISEIEESYILSCLESFRLYFTCIRKNLNEPVYQGLNQELGETIQLDIHQTLNPQQEAESFFEPVYRVVKNLLA